MRFLGVDVLTWAGLGLLGLAAAALLWRMVLDALGARPNRRLLQRVASLEEELDRVALQRTPFPNARLPPADPVVSSPPPRRRRPPELRIYRGPPD